jgi:hypothetical protein
MRFVGWLASALGLVGIVVCNGLASLVWVLRRDLRARAGDLMAVPDAGLEVAITLTDGVSGWLVDVLGRIADIRARADDLVAAPVVDPVAANDLAAAIDEFIGGPYATMRAAYTGLRERAIAVSEALRGVGRAVPVLAISGVVAERLQAIDASLVEVDESMTALAQAGPAGLSEPGVAAAVSERAAFAEERFGAIAELVTDVEAWLHDTRDRVVEADRRTARLLTVGAVAGTILSLFAAGLNVLLFQQGRRWSRRDPTYRG